MQLNLKKLFLPAVIVIALAAAVFAVIYLNGNLLKGELEFGQKNTYYLATDGNDQADGGSNAPWLTWNFALKKLQPGDTLLLKDGTYDEVHNGKALIDCNAGIQNGSAMSQITIKAQNERKAILTSWEGPSKAWNALKIQNCQYWNIEGLYFLGSDNKDSNGQGGVLDIYRTKNINVKRVVVSNTNRYANSPGIFLLISKNTTVEESEIMSFHLYGIDDMVSNGDVFRRNYISCAKYPVIAGQYSYPASTVGSDCYATRYSIALYLYSSQDSIVENNISENNGYGFDILEQQSGDGSNNRFFGNISLNDGLGMFIDNRSKNQNGTVLENMLFVGTNPYGAIRLYDYSQNKIGCKNCSFVGAGALEQVRAFECDKADCGTNIENNTLEIINSLFVNNQSSKLFQINNYGKCTISKSVGWNNKDNSLPELCGKDALINTDPNLGVEEGSQFGSGQGQCLVYISNKNAALKGQGVDGEDIGANIVYRYENGILTQTALWDFATGQFACGADVLGDAYPLRCANVNQRLNVGFNGCAVPPVKIESNPISELNATPEPESESVAETEQTADPAPESEPDPAPDPAPETESAPEPAPEHASVPEPDPEPVSESTSVTASGAASIPDPHPSPAQNSQSGGGTNTTHGSAPVSANVRKKVSKYCEEYIDFLATDPACPALKFVKEIGAMTKSFAGRFNPQGILHRDEVVKIVNFGAFDENENYCQGKAPFLDITPSSWSYQRICQAKQSGVAKGYNAGVDFGYFRPERTINRVEFLALLFRSIKFPTPRIISNTYLDVPANAWFKTTAAISSKYKLFEGKYLFPEMPMTRIEAAKILYKLYQLGIIKLKYSKVDNTFGNF